MPALGTAGIIGFAFTTNVEVDIFDFAVASS